MQYGCLKGEKIGENICGRGVGKRVGAEEGLFMGVHLWGTHGVRPYGIWDGVA